MEKHEVFHHLREMQVTKVELSFSGGNDEGGVDSQAWYGAEGQEVNQLAVNAYVDVHRDYSFAKQQFPDLVGKLVIRDSYNALPRLATHEEIRLCSLRQAMEAPIYKRWGSFAGDFSVSGTLVWNVADGTVKLDGQESVEQYEHFESDL